MIFDVGFPVMALPESSNPAAWHICAVNGSDVRCWGDGQLGKLGYGNNNSIGDDELPSSVGNVLYL